jgi:hypothetical protein
VKRAPLPYVLLGLVAAGERRSRDALSIGVRAAEVVVWPAVIGWRSPLAAPLRRRANVSSNELARDGREFAARARAASLAASGELLRRLADELAESGLADEIVDRLLRTGAFDRAVTIVINHPATEALVAGALDDPGIDRLIARVMDSRMIDELTARLLESEELRLILDYVTRSPELRAALAHQTAGIAEDVAVSVRSHTVVADDAAERFARALFRRRRRPEIR